MSRLDGTIDAVVDLCVCGVARADGAEMSTELDRIELGRLAGLGGFFDRSGQATVWYHKRHLMWLPVLPVAALAGAVIWFSYGGGRVESEPAQSATASIETLPSTPAPATVVLPDPAISAVASIPAAPVDKPVDSSAQAAEPPAIDGLSISSQSWRWGGLGSKAFVTLTLRNNNDYAIKDIELHCSFVRRDGSHLTDRMRLIPDIVNMKSRKTFPNMLVGFVNINASRAKCTAVAANRT
jgi:hypothetical protein